MRGFGITWGWVKDDSHDFGLTIYLSADISTFPAYDDDLNIITTWSQVS